MGIPAQPRLLERVRLALRARHYSHLTERAYVGWIRRYILFHHKRHPADMGAAEVEAFLGYLATTRATLLYGAGLRLMECLRLRVKDIDFATRQIMVRGGKGDRDRVTILPAGSVPALEVHLRRRRDQHLADLRRGFGAVHLPDEEVSTTMIYTHAAGLGATGAASPLDTWLGPPRAR